MPKKTKQPAKKEVGQKKEVSAGAGQQRIAYLAEEKFEKEKRMIMWTGVSFFMILIMIFWVINFQRNFKAIAMDQKGGLPDWQQVTQQFQATMNNTSEVKNEIQKVGTVVASTTSGAADQIQYEAAATDKIISTTTRNSFLPALRTKLEDSQLEIKK